MSEQINDESKVRFKLEKNIIIRGKIIAKTGLHIGGNKDSLRISGLDAPIMRDPITNLPLIPGSSIKGKMRSLLELSEGNYDEDGKPHGTKSCHNELCDICVIFGSSTNEKTNLTRLIVRDALIDKKMDQEGDMTEYKIENSIDRLRGSAISPRTMERVVRESVFKFEMIYSIFGKNDDEKKLVKVFEAMNLIEDSYLGGSGSRGYGKVKFTITSIVVKSIQQYIENKIGVEIFSDKKGKAISEIDNIIKTLVNSKGRGNEI